MSRTLRSAHRLFLAVLFALSTMVHQRAEARLLRTDDCRSSGACQLRAHGATLVEGADALTAPVPRPGIVLLRLVPRGTATADERAGVDVLFRARNQLLLARARAVLDHLRDRTPALQAATRGIAATPSRAPPALS